MNNDFLKAFPENTLEFLKKFFNKIYNAQKTLDEWSKIIVSMIYKKGDKEKVANYRSIALVNCLTKVFTAI